MDTLIYGDGTKIILLRMKWRFQIYMAVAIGTNSLVALRATKLLLTPTQSRDYILITAQYR